MPSVTDTMLRGQLLDRRRRLETATSAEGESPNLTRLLREVDAALDRMDGGTFGLCEACHDPIETDRLIADPLVRFCLDHLTPAEQRALEQDLELAASIQRSLLPPPSLRVDGWEVSHRYQPLGRVSGDFCDVVGGEDGGLHFVLGDVSGKGIAASMLMAQLHAMFRALIPVGLPLGALVERASRLFCESTLPTHFATLVCGRARPSGEVEVLNAGHPPALHLREGAVERIGATGLPLGVFRDERFEVKTLRMLPGATLLVYTDGLSESRNASGAEYGIERLARLAGSLHGHSPQAVIEACLGDADVFRSGAPNIDDLTVMAIRKLG